MLTKTIAILVGLAACSPGNGATGPSNPVAVTGTIGGNAFVAGDAVATTNVGLMLHVTTWTGACAHAMADTAVAGGSILDLSFFDAPPDGSDGVPAIAPATFTIVQAAATPKPAHYAMGSVTTLSATCTASGGTLAASGTVKLSSLNSNGIAGEGDVTFTTGDHLHVQFVAPTCTAAPSSHPGCVPN